MLSVVSYITYKSKNFDLLTCSVVGICPKLMQQIVFIKLLLKDCPEVCFTKRTNQIETKAYYGFSQCTEPIKKSIYLSGITSTCVPSESSESYANVLKAYQSLEPGDFTGFLKLLRSPSSQRLQSRCTAFLNTMEAYHVIIFFNKFNVTLFIQQPPFGMSELIVGSHHLYRICRYRSSRILCKISTSLLQNILAVSKDQFNTVWAVNCENTTIINHFELLFLIFRFS